MSVKKLRGLLPLSLLALLSGCHTVLLHPEGDVARQQSDLMIHSVYLLSLIIVPVLIAVFVIAWRYRASNKHAEYDPDWDHSTQLELVVWAAPLLIIIALGAMTWIGTHQLDPYRPLSRIDDGKSISLSDKPLEVEVVSMDWKWLFIYPQYGIATVNELAAPVDRPIHFKLTSARMMNTFFVPTLAGQVYTMAGMQTQLHAVINKPGTYKGFSANYSGLGFTDMRFTFKGMTRKAFDSWVGKARAIGRSLSLAAYRELNKPSRNVPPRAYASYAPDLYHRVLNMCVNPGQVCMNKMMALDAQRNRWGSERAGPDAHPKPDASPATPSDANAH
jgi:cytochrome o ubiquinol oxidase subunit II